MPRPARTLVTAKVHKMWPREQWDAVMAALDEYGREGSSWGCTRVQLAILKLCGGNRDEIPKLVETANRDYRDVIAWAENPEAIRLLWAVRKEMSRAEIAAMRRRDKRQYRRWLRK